MAWQTKSNTACESKAGYSCSQSSVGSAAPPESHSENYLPDFAAVDAAARLKLQQLPGPASAAELVAAEVVEEI